MPIDAPWHAFNDSTYPAFRSMSCSGEHNKSFYQLCTHMEPGYHQLEFDLRLYLTQREIPQP